VAGVVLLLALHVCGGQVGIVAGVALGVHILTHIPPPVPVTPLLVEDLPAVPPYIDHITGVRTFGWCVFFSMAKLNQEIWISLL